MVGSGIGGKGVFSGTDSLQIKGTRSVSISEKQDPPGVVDGYVHFVLLQ